MEIQKLKKLFQSCESSASVQRGVLTELERYVVPYRGEMFKKSGGESSVDWDKYDHYDDTAVLSAALLAASIHGAILPQLQWFDLKYTNEDIQNNNEYANWLADSAKRVYHAIDNSNFSLESDELILDLVGFGHGFMIDEFTEDESFYSVIPIKEAYFIEGWDGLPTHFFRRLEWTANKIVDKFGIDNVPDCIKKKYENSSDVTETITIIFAIFPRDLDEIDTSKPLAPKARPFGYKYFILESGEQIGEEGGYYSMPVYSVRWRKTSGSQWGHGPGHIALGDIKQLNQHRLMRTRAIEKAVDPANITTERGLMSNLNLGPRGLTVVRKMDELAPYESRANFAISNDELGLLQKSIKQAFMADQLELKESPAMTATEVQVRYELMHRLLGPTLGRIKVDWLNLVVESTFNNELRSGRLLEMPEGLAELDPDISIEFIGALATSQKSQQANDMVEWAGVMAQMAQAYPDMKYLVNEDELGREVARLKNIPEKAINGKNEVEKAKNADADMVFRQQQLIEAQAEGQAMKAQGEGMQAMDAANNGEVA